MGTVGGLRTRRYHGLLVVATQPPGVRMLGLAALDPVLVVGDARVRLAVHEWAGGAVDPTGHLQLAALRRSTDGVPRWRWAIGDTILEREIAPIHGRPASRRRPPARPRRTAGTTRARSARHLARRARRAASATGPPRVEPVADGFVFEGAYRVAGPGFVPAGEWYRGVRYREEAARGLPDREDLWHAGTFAAELAAGRRR